MKRELSLILMLFSSVLMFSQTSGGPDPYGYTWRNTDNPTSPPPFKWKEIQTIGTQVTGLLDDNYIGPFNVSNGFQFYWYNTPQFYVGSNGYISFNGDNISSAFPPSIPLSSGANNWVAPLMADLNFGNPPNPATCYYWSNTDSLVVSYYEVPLWTSVGNKQTGSNTFQVIFDKNDFSITFNYLSTNKGTVTNLDDLIGIENITGTLGLAALVDSLPRDSFCIKFYYPPSTTYQAIDGGMNWNNNDENAGFFVKSKGAKIPLSANTKNYGNTSLSSFTVNDTIYTFSGNVVTNGVATAPALTAGSSATVLFSDSFSANSEGIYKFHSHLSGITGDLVPSNNQLEQEIVAVDTTANFMWLEYSDGQPDGTGLGWNGGGGGIGIYITPPIYPAKITKSRFYISANASPAVGFHALLYADDGTNGAPGTLLDSVFVSGNSITLNQYEIVTTGNDVVIDSGGVYLVWLMDGAGINLARDLTRPFSRRTYEILGAGFSNYRDKLTEDFLLGIRVEYAYPKADFAAVLGTDPIINFYDMSTRNPTDWYWEFGDGDTSTQKDPIHTYQWNGTYDVCLTASNQWGSDSICKKVTVAGIPAMAKFVYDASALPLVVFTDSSSGPPTAWAWDFDDGGVLDQSIVQHPSYTFKNAGKHNVCLRVSNALGISAPYCDTVAFAVGVKEYFDHDFKVFPNPMTDRAQILLPSSLDGNQIEVRMMSLSGAEVNCEVVKEKDQLTIGKKNLDAGTYILELSKEGNIISHISLQVQ